MAGNDGNFFDCNICLDLAKDPVVTCCGHLFCWPCLYRWIYNYSDAKDCPVCKGGVSMKNVTPIYGRGNHIHISEPSVDSNLKLPVRPRARRIESWRETMLDLSQESRRIQPRNHGPNRIVDRFLSWLGSDNVVHHSTESSPPNLRARFLSYRSLSRRVRRSHVLGAANLFNAIPVNGNSGERNEGRAGFLPFDDRGSVSTSIAAVIQSGRQTVDDPVEYESTVFSSTLTSRRRRRESLRQSVEDSGDSSEGGRRRLD